MTIRMGMNEFRAGTPINCADFYHKESKAQKKSLNPMPRLKLPPGAPPLISEGTWLSPGCEIL